VGTVILGIVFLLAFIIFLAADLVSDILLNPAVYTSALDESDFYGRIYTDLLADPAVAEATSNMLGNLDLNPSMAEGILSFTTSTLYLVAPPDTIQGGVEGFINNFTAYLRGDTEELQTRIDLTAGVDGEIIANRIVDGVLALSAELFVEIVPEVKLATGPDTDEINAYLAEIGAGRIGPVPESAAASLENLSQEEKQALADLLLGPAADAVPESTRFQIEAALFADDLPGALSMATGLLLRDRVKAAAGEYVEALKNSPSLDSLTSAAAALGQTGAELMGTINRVREVMIFLDRVAMPLMFGLMILSLGAIIWIHSNNLVEMLRTAGLTLVISTGLVALGWLILGLLLRGSLESRFVASSELPASLENMIGDVVAILFGNVWSELWPLALVPFVIGLVLVILSFIHRLSDSVKSFLWPLWQFNKLIFVTLLLAIILIPILLGSLIRKSRQPELACNGHAELCDRPVNEVAFAATHNGMSIAEYGWIWPSHDGSVTDQLNAGVRALLIDTHYWDDQAWIEDELEALPPDIQDAVNGILGKVELSKVDGSYLCHMMCGLGGTELTETLEEIQMFLESHPNEVVAIVFEDLLTPADTEQAFVDSGLDSFVYTYEPGTEWPTLREMIESNQRLIVMAENEGAPPDWYLNAWDYTEETPYNFTDINDFDDTSCRPNRGDTGKPFFLFNHWITRASPSRIDAAILNDYDYLMERAQRCADERGQLPNFVAVNFYLNGDLFDVVDELNGVRDPVEQ
jgi:hypothetical protein